MTPYSYLELKKHVCKQCGTVFESGHPNAYYCTIKCQRMAKAQRRAFRDAGLRAHTEIVATESRFFAEVENPTTVQLSKYAELMREELTNDKPIRFYGTIPMWQPPDGIIFAEQHGLEKPEWLMLHPAMIE